MTSPKPHMSVLVIGASRGLGFAITKEYLAKGAHVVATTLGAERSALHDLQSTADNRLEIEQVDITDPDQIVVLRARLAGREFDLLFNVAGVTNQAHPAGPTPVEISTEEFIRLMVTNALSPMRVIETLEDLVAPTGTIAIMSSGQGSVADNDKGGFEIYRASKSALNQMMRSYAARHHDDSRTLLLMAPGWVKTELGGPEARLTVEESIPKLVGVVDAQDDRPGLQFLDYLGRTVAW